MFEKFLGATLVSFQIALFCEQLRFSGWLVKQSFGDGGGGRQNRGD